MRHTLLLFDVDGTLINAHGSGGRAWRAASRRLFGEGFDFNGVAFAGRLDHSIYVDLAIHNGIADHEEKQAEFWAMYLEELPRELERSADRIAVCPGVAGLLTLLRESHADRAMLGLLTGNHSGAVPHKLGAIDIDHGWFPIGAFGDEAHERPDLTVLAMKRYAKHTGDAAKPDRVIIIGDTPADIDCAKAHGCIAFAVATGPYDAKALRDAGADIVVEDLRDPTPLIELL